MSTTDPNSTENAAERDDVRSDEDWKRRVKAEDAALDETLKSEQPPSGGHRPEVGPAKAEEPDSESPAPIPQTASSARATPETEPAEDGPAAAESSTRSAEPMPMPPATFETLIGMFSTQAMVALGLIPNPATGKAERMPELAQHFIDLLSVVETKTAGNLEGREQSLLETSLHQLRMAYVQLTKAPASAESGDEAKRD